ncbi:MAG: YihY/virulence factor BrkB family protein [Chitinophagaceae bacterium]|nr:YihY/virulence factor BrkB family protein [Chitinophagaceae bacterium]
MNKKTVRKNIPAFQNFNRWSRKWKPPGFQGQSVFDIVQFIRHNFDMQGFYERAAAISYNFIMSLPPTCLFIFTLIPNLPFFSKRGIRLQLHALIRDIIPSQVYNRQLISFVDSFIDGSKIGIMSFTVILSLFFASNGVMGLMRSFNRKDYIGFRTLKGIKQRMKAVGLTLMLFGLLLGTLLLLFLQTKILRWMGVHNDSVTSLILVARWIAIGLLIFFSFGFIYRYAPSTTKRWRLFSPGAVVATALSIIVTVGFSFFVNNFGSYNILYGSIGSVMVIMIMVYLNSLAAFIGFMVNLSVHSLETRRERRNSK